MAEADRAVASGCDPNMRGRRNAAPVSSGGCGSILIGVEVGAGGRLLFSGAMRGRHFGRVLLAITTGLAGLAAVPGGPGQ